MSAACSLLLAAVFAWAGLAKVRRPSSMHATLRAVGLPRGLIRIAATALPAAELVVAGALLTRPFVGGVAAAALLLAFTAAVARVHRSGRRITCGCFGSADDQPVGAHLYLRNGWLMICALTIMTASGANEGLSGLSLPAVLTVGAVAVVAMLGGALVRLRNEVGAILPSVTVPAITER
jgi:hypothetical protein